MSPLLKGMAVTLTCFLSAADAPAQMPKMQGPNIRGVWNPVVGSGAVYEVQDKKEKRTMEISIVGKESVNGKDAYWLEYGIEDRKQGGMMYMKMLVSVDQSNVITQRMIMQIPGQSQPMEMTMAAQRGSEKQSADVRQESERVGSETVPTPAGTFTCEHYRMKDGSADVWSSSKVAPWGLVKSVGKDSTMVLQKMLTDVKDHITGTPVKFDPMQMMQQMPRP